MYPCSLETLCFTYAVYEEKKMRHNRDNALIIDWSIGCVARGQWKSSFFFTSNRETKKSCETNKQENRPKGEKEGRSK